MKNTKIQWADDTVNAVVGCGGCELWPTSSRKVERALKDVLGESSTAALQGLVSGWTPQDFVRRKSELAQTLADELGNPEVVPKVKSAIDGVCRCYAGVLHSRYSGYSSGFARDFNTPEFFEGRMAQAGNWGDLSGKPRTDKPWLNGFPRLIFVSDMGDALTKGMPFPLLQKEIIDVVASEKGRRHVWFWLTKRPPRMAEFSDWLHERYISWPDNLVAMTSVTGRKTVSRVNDLRRVRCRLRGLSVEPLWESVELPLKGIDWVIVGGESGSAANPFDLAWARELREQCREADVAFFVKQLGSNPVEDGEPLKLKDGHGGDWNEWPEDLRVREFPETFRSIAYELRRRDGVEVSA
jgi:protein gp37